MTWKIPPSTNDLIKKMLLDFQYQPKETFTDILEYLRGYDDHKRNLHKISRAYIMQNMPKGTESVVAPNQSIIGYKAFEACTGLSNVEVQSNVTIGRKAFQGCNNLTSFTISDRACIHTDAFSHLSKLKTVEIGTKAKIRSYAFLGCTGLTELTINQGSHIESHAFYSCTGLTELTINENSHIGLSAFLGCTGLTKLTIKQGVTINTCAFKGCTGLTEFTVEQGVTINSSAFRDCTGLKKVVLKGDISHFNIKAFERCDNLCLIIVPDNFEQEKPLLYGITVVTHAEHEKMNDFYSKYGFQDLELKDKIKIYKLCHSSDEVNQADFEQLSHLSVSTMLTFIQAYSDKDGNAKQGKTLLEWTMGHDFMKSLNDEEALDMKKMILSARGFGNRVLRLVQGFTTVYDWCKKTHPVSKRFNDNLFSSTREETGSEEKSEDGLEPKSTPKRSR